MLENVQSSRANNSFFDGYYKDIWRQTFPEKTTLAEIDWIIREGNLNAGNTVLDVMCGYGRHSLELGRRGLRVTAIDNLPDYINEIRDTKERENLPIEALCEDVLEMALDSQYDVAICMGNSLQFFNEQETLRLLASISERLKPAGKLFINTWSIAEIAMKIFKEKSWGRFGDLLFLTDCKLLFHPTRMEINSLIITDSGEREEKTGVDFIYSISELEGMLNKTGFDLKEIYSIPGKKIFTVGEPRAYIVAEKLST